MALLQPEEVDDQQEELHNQLGYTFGIGIIDGA